MWLCVSGSDREGETGSEIGSGESIVRVPMDWRGQYKGGGRLIVD